MVLRGVLCKDCPTSLLVVYDSPIEDDPVLRFFDQVHDEEHGHQKHSHTEIIPLNATEILLYLHLKQSILQNVKPRDEHSQRAV